MAFVNDTLTDTNGVLLTAHVGELGATWTKHPSLASSSILFAGNRVYTGAANSLYLASGTPAGTDYEVEEVIFVNTLANPIMFVVAQCDTAAVTYYAGGAATASAQYQIRRVIAGASTTIATAAVTFTPATSYTIKLVVRPGSQKLYVGGVEVASATDTSITAAGRVGIWGSPNGLSNAGTNVASFSATDLVPIVADDDESTEEEERSRFITQFVVNSASRMW